MDNLKGHQTPEEIMTWLEAVAASWNRTPPVFQWGGQRAAAALVSVSLVMLSVARAHAPGVLQVGS